MDLVVFAVEDGGDLTGGETGGVSEENLHFSGA